MSWDFRFDPAMVHEIGTRFMPILRFDPEEHHFPVNPDSWLVHTGREVWFAPDGIQSHGTAIWESADGDTNPHHARVLGGHAPMAEDTPPHPMELSTDASPDAIGNPAYTNHDSEYGWRLFLKVGGWDRLDSDHRFAGNQGYLRIMYHESRARLDPETPSPPDIVSGISFAHDVEPYAPWLTVEAAWAPSILARSRLLNMDFGPAAITIASRFERYLALTYHMLYPALERPIGEFIPPPGGTSTRLREGQWEGITLLFRADHIEQKRPNEVPTLMRFESDGPRVAIYSQNYNIRMNAQDEAIAAVRTWDGGNVSVVRQGLHPIVYVALGTHKNMFEPSQLIVMPGRPEVPARMGMAVATVMPITTGLMSASGALLTGAGLFALLMRIIAPFPAPPAFGPPGVAPIITTSAVLLLGAIVCFFVGLLLWLLAALTSEAAAAADRAFPSTPGMAAVPERIVPPVDARNEIALARGTGAAAIPAGIDPTSPRDPDAGVAARIAPIAFAAVSPHIESGPGSPPPWWRFAGRWGLVASDPAFAGFTPRWLDGTFRDDPAGRTQAYWHLLEAYRQSGTAFEL